MSRPRMFRVPPDLRVRGLNPGMTAPAVVNAPVRVSRGLSGQNNFPGPNGGPGSSVWPYTENMQFNPQGGSPGASLLAPPPPVGLPPAGLTPAQMSMVSTPNGQSERDWINPTTYATIPLNASFVGSNSPVLQLNYKRNSLIIQNTSTATAPDTPPTLYINFNAEPQVLGALALPPGLGFYWSAADCPPRDAIYVAFGPFVDAGNTVVISGCVVQGTYTPKG